MLAEIRSRVVEFARSMPFSRDQIEDIRLAVGEAGANAIRHGRAPGSCNIHVKMERYPGCLKVQISDSGCGFDPRSVTVPPPASLRAGGRGIMLMRALVDEVEFHFTSPGTRVDLTKRFQTGQPGKVAA
jgi:anti-sigma regulatory factor (Ser/Thr protein kinase)